jgi:predicted PurR-regulated permease PerM
MPPARCVNITVTIRKINNTNTDEHFYSTIPLKNITKRLVSIYETAAQDSFIQLESKMQQSNFSFKRIIEKFLSLIMSVVALILLGVLLFILKYLKIKTQKQVNKIQTDLNKLKSEVIDEILCQ